MAIEFTVDHDHTYASDQGIEPLIGWITFSVGTYPGDFRVREQGAGAPRTMNIPPRRGWLSADGHLYKDQTLEQPCRLVANDPAFNLRHLTYRADFGLTTVLGEPVAVPTTYFPGPGTDTTLYLTKVMADPSQPVMEVRTSGYVEDIIDAGPIGGDLVRTATLEDAWGILGADLETAQVAIGLTDTGQAIISAEDGAEVRTVIGAVSPDDIVDTVDSAVIAAVAADSTVKGAAASAVGTALDDAGVVRGGSALPSSDLSFMLTDNVGRYSWIATDNAGGVPAHSADMIWSALNLGFDASQLLVSPTDADLAFAVADADGNRSDLELGYDGRFTDRVIASLRERIDTNTGVIPEIVSDKVYLTAVASGSRTLLGTVSGASSPTLLSPTAVRVETPSGSKWLSTTSSVARPVFPSQTIAAWGDSLTYGATLIGGTPPYVAASPPYPTTTAADLTGYSVFNGGVPGQGCSGIAVRQGGLQPLLTVTGNEIPSGTGGVSVPTISPSDGWSGADGTYDMHGSLAGVAGNLRHVIAAGPTHTFSFIPDASVPSPVSVPAGTPFVGDEGDVYRDALQLIWSGTNNGSSGLSPVKRDIASMVAHLTTYSTRFLVINAVAEFNDDLAATYGERYVDLRTWLSANGLAAAGVTPTSGDTAAMEAGNIPPSLLVDGVHFTQAGYTVIGHHIATVIASLGWN